MIISFDIENTLVLYSGESEVEERNFLSKIIRAEFTRRGIIGLFSSLENQGI